MTRKRWIPAVLIFGAVLLFPPPAHANVMLPVIFVGWLGMIPALIPIILIESAMLMRIDAGIGESLLAMSAANLVSTLVGIPLAIILEIVVGNTTPLYDDDESNEWNEWLWSAGGMLIMVPFFLLSWWIEAPIATWFLDEFPSRTVDHAVRDANLVTYAILALLIGGVFTWYLLDTAEERKTERVKRTTEKYVDPTIHMDAWQAANWHARRGIAKLRAKEAEIVRRYQARSRCSDKPWRLANKRARRGIAWLRTAETAIDRQRPIQAAAGVRRFEDVYDVKAA